MSFNFVPVGDKVLLLPQNTDAEQGICALFIHHPAEVGAALAAANVTSATLHSPVFALILETLALLWVEQKNPDYVTLCAALDAAGALDRVGGSQFIAVLMTESAIPSMLDEYIRLICKAKAKREIIRACQVATEKAYDPEIDASEVVSDLSNSVTQIALMGEVKKRKSMRSIIRSKMIDMAAEQNGHRIITTGLAKLDEESPLNLGDMPLIVGETKAGKSILALNIAAHIASTQGPVIFFSLEDSAEKPVDRILANWSSVPIDRHHQSRLSKDDLARLSAQMERIVTTPIEIRDDCTELGSIVAAIVQFAGKHADAKAAFIDYAQLIAGSRRKNDSRQQELAIVSRTIRQLSIKLDIAIVLLSQLNSVGNTREAQDLEMDTTAIWKVELTDQHSKRMLCIPRQRNGASGIAFPLSFQGSIARFTDYDGPDDEETSEETPTRKPNKKRQWAK